MCIKSLLFPMLLSLSASFAFAGAWGHGSFENDDALDWVENDLKSAGQGGIQKALKAVTSAKGYLEAPECCAAIAACEVVAAAQGRPSPDLPKDVAAIAKKLAREQSEAVRKEARAALDRILEKSELRSLWEEAKEFEVWKKAIAALRARL